MYELKINDLRRLGRLGNATATMNNGRIGDIRTDGLYFILNNAVIGSTPAQIKFKQDFGKAIGNIHHIRLGTNIIAVRLAKKLVANEHYPLDKAPL